MSKNRLADSSSILLAALLIASTLSLACNNAAAPRPLSSSKDAVDKKPATNQQAIKDSLDVPIAKLDGGTFKLEDYRGKVLVVDFWATYCPPCVKQAPQLAALNERYRDRGLVVVGLTSDPKDDQQKVEEFIKKAGINYTIGYDNSWLSGAFMKGTEDDSGQPPIPQLFVIARDGRVVEHLIGEQPGRMQYLEKVVNEQLGSSR
ncbi:MAG: TlpA family protein disulfide reductase [Acidobacteriota bacterium]|nr:TlpA family protein disulfide reductase [Acidobacteriota bacterium]